MTDTHLHSDFLIYGAYGYSGALIARRAVERGFRPVLGGRDASRLADLAGSLGLPSRTFSLQDSAAVDKALSGVKVVLNCAGPFIHTWQPMFEACVRNRVHYLDITGEYLVIENLARRGDEAKNAGILLIPGLGFDVVPSDCLAMHLKQRLPEAARLVLAFRTLGRFSQGTARTAIENLSQPSIIRRGGQLIPVAAGSRMRRIDFGRGAVKTVAISWGDISSAYYSTGIPNIEVYTPIPANLLRVLRYVGRGPGVNLMKNLFQLLIRSQPMGPSVQERQRGLGLLWGEVIDNTGRRAISRLTTPEPYALTAMTAVDAIAQVLETRVLPGFKTPALAFGKNFILEIPGCAREDVI